MEKSIYRRLYDLVAGYWPFLLASSISAFIYVAFNGLSVSDRIYAKPEIGRAHV